MSAKPFGICSGDNSLRIVKKLDGSDVSRLSAFANNAKLEIYAYVTRRLGISGAVLCLYDDKLQSDTELALAFEGVEGSCDVYRITLDFEKHCNGDTNLYYWCLKLFCADGRVQYTDSINNVDFVLSENENIRRTRLLVYDKDFDTPLWAKEGVMYQIFVDRFCRGSEKVPAREDAVMIDDWYEGIPEYPEKNGDALANNSFFGGTLYGVVEKLDYLKELGVSVLYFCPVFKAYSNHKYDTGDYETVDEMFGGDEAFDLLCKKAKEKGMRIVLDGVFNHTGDNSKYFNRYGSYRDVGAYQSKDSEYYNWYNFENHPDKYEAWWGIEILPRIKGNTEAVRNYFLSENGIVRKWLKRGISGWRLDVADELDEDFLKGIRQSAKTEKKDSLIIGEVWENAADKVSYNKRREYFRGKELDSVMNYPIKNAIIDFVKSANAKDFYNAVTDVYSSYPPFCSAVLMNIIGTHDTERILTVLAGQSSEGKTNKELSAMKLSEKQLEEGIKRLMVASCLQFTLPGMPSIYYGDEAGVEGYHDPFCRRPYPWGRENKRILEHYKKLCKIKREQASLHTADLEFEEYEHGFVVFTRGEILVLVNVSDSEKSYKIHHPKTDLVEGNKIGGEITLSPMSFKILK